MVITGVFLVHIIFGDATEIIFESPSLKQMPNIRLVCTSPVPVEGDYWINSKSPVPADVQKCFSSKSPVYAHF